LIETKNNKSINFHHNVAIFDHNVASKHKSITMKQIQKFPSIPGVYDTFFFLGRFSGTTLALSTPGSLH
jgi:hypothetical protein